MYQISFLLPFPTKVFFFLRKGKNIYLKLFFFASGQYLFNFFFFRWAPVFICFLFFLLENWFSRFVLDIFQSNRLHFLPKFHRFEAVFKNSKWNLELSLIYYIYPIRSQRILIKIRYLKSWDWELQNGAKIVKIGHDLMG